MTNKTEAVPLLSKQLAKSIIDSHCDACAAQLIECLTQEEQDGLDAIADGRATVIATADLAAKDAEIERLQNLIGEWERKAANWFASPEAAQQLDGYRELAMRACNAENEKESLRRDAYLYRWLRNDATTHLYVRQYRDGIAEPVNGHDLDAAIDAAMQGDKSE